MRNLHSGGFLFQEKSLLSLRLIPGTQVCLSTYMVCVTVVQGALHIRDTGLIEREVLKIGNQTTPG